MSETTIGRECVEEPAGGAMPAAASDEQLVAMLVDRARSEGLQLTGEGGLLRQLTKRVPESVLEGEITDHVGYEKHDPAGKNNGNSRNGTRAKTVLTDVGPVEVRVPRDTAGREPQLCRAGLVGQFVELAQDSAVHRQHGVGPPQPPSRG